MSETKECPYCAEIIKAGAIKCKHCHTMLDQVEIYSNLKGKMANLYNNTVQANEKVSVCITPFMGQAIVVTDKRVVIIEASTFSAKTTSIYYNQINSLDFSIKLLGGQIELTTAENKHLLRFDTNHKELIGDVVKIIQNNLMPSKNSYPVVEKAKPEPIDLPQEKSPVELTMYLQEEAKCPYCHKPLSKAPSRKSKCPNCKEAFYVRTRPSDRKKVIVTEEGVKDIEAAWEQYHAEQEAKDLENMPDDISNYEKSCRLAKIALSRKENDKAWGYYNRAIGEAVQAGKFRKYRWIRYEMAEQLIREGRHKYALDFLCEVIYLDICGITDSLYIWKINDPWLDSGEKGLLIPRVVKYTRDLIKETEMSKNEFQQIALTACENIYRGFKGPLPPNDAMPVLLEVALGETFPENIPLPVLKKNN